MGEFKWLVRMRSFGYSDFVTCAYVASVSHVSSTDDFARAGDVYGPASLDLVKCRCRRILRNCTPESDVGGALEVPCPGGAWGLDFQDCYFSDFHDK